MTELVATRGIPASGKTTYARAWVAEDEQRRARVNRDDLRQLLYGRDAPLPSELEEVLTVAQHAAVRHLLRANVSVIVDDMHLRMRYLRAWQEIAEEEGAGFRVELIDAPLATCLRRDQDRWENGHRAVGQEFIRECHARLRSSVRETLEPVAKLPPYFPNLALAAAWLVDLDGTLAIKQTDRSFFEWHRVGEDAPNQPIVNVVRALAGAGWDIVVVSGRDAVCERESMDWLNANRVPCRALYMRAQGDTSRDAVVKRELLDEVSRRWRVVGTIDDRDQVVKMWRSVGLPCLQVAEGDF